MSLRLFILLFSGIIIIFCLSLVFKGNTELASFDIDSYQHRDYQEGRSHSLADLSKEIHPHKIEQFIESARQRNRMIREKTRVMEIGTGNGRVLMELLKIFPDVEFYGVNKEKTLTLYRRESFIHTGLKFNIFTDEEIKKIDLPYLIFRDLDQGGKIPYDENKFDVVFSQSTFPFIKYKVELLNEIQRILRPGGVTIHTHFEENNSLFYQGSPIDHFHLGLELKKRGFDVEFPSPSVILFKKGKDFRPLPLKPKIAPFSTDRIPEKVEYDFISI